VCLAVATSTFAVARSEVAPPTTAAVPDTMYVVAPIVVEAARVLPSDRLLDRSGFVAVLETGERAGRVEDLSHALSQLVGVRVNQYGGLGSFATVSIRGSASNQVRVFVDGIPVDDAYLGVIDVSQLPLGAVERIEVYRGISPPALGASSLGGAINLVTSSGAGEEVAWVSRAEVHESYGSFDTSRHRASLWSNRPWAQLYLHAGYSQSLGDFEFVDDNGTPASVADDAVTARANNDFNSWSATARATTEVTGVADVTVGYDATQLERGVPGIGSYQSLRARSRRRRDTGFVRAESSPFSPRLQLAARAFYSRSRDEFDDMEASIALRPTRSIGEIRSYGGRARARWLIPAPALALEGVLASRLERYHPESRVSTVEVGPDRWRRSHSASLGVEVYLMNESLMLAVTQHIEWQSNEFFLESDLAGVPPTPRGRFTERSESPSAGLRWRLGPGVTLKANAGRYYRLPTFLELFGNLGAVTGNAELRPESGVNSDVGLILALGRIGPFRSTLVEAVYLHNEVDDLILFFPNSQRTSRPVNIGAATIRGVELSASASAYGLDLAARYTYLDTEDTGAVPYYRGNDLPSRPRHDLSASVSYARAPWRFTYELHTIGANYLNRANLQEAPARQLHNVIVNFDVLTSALALTLEGRNLSDNQVSDVNGFPLPGRSFYSTLGYRYLR
jgi:iron complex outermembrane receptor protein